MSPITATLKCPHGRGKDTIESEAVAEVASHKDGGGREDYLKNNPLKSLPTSLSQREEKPFLLLTKRDEGD